MTQAKALAESLKTEPVSHILCSDLKRASRTAGAIAEHHPDTLVVSHQLLREQDFGELEGKSWRETWTADAATREHAMALFGESNDALAERAGLAWDWVLEQVLPAEEPQLVIVVSHGLFLSALLTNICLCYGTPRPANVHWGNTGYVRFTLMNDQIPVLVFDRINESGHLAGIQRQKGIGSSKFDEKQKPISQFFRATPQKK
jgi:broad specificity phosphatase PhoE